MIERDAILAANAAYYRAFAASDIAAMERVWAHDNVSCVHPGWPALIGHDRVMASYREILGNSNQQRIDHRHEVVLADADDGRVHCVEFVGGMALAATNWFRRFGADWRMVHHQASPIAALAAPEPPAAPSRLN